MDLIQTAIDEILERRGDEYHNEYECGYYDALTDAVGWLKRLQSEEPELATNLQQSCNQLAADTISRHGAIDLVRDVCDEILSQCGSHYDGEDEVYDSILEVHTILKCNKEIRIALAGMPSAEPEDTIEMQEADIDETMKRLRDARVTILPSAEPVRCKDCRWGREACGNIECFVDSNIPPEYHGYEWFCPNGDRRADE